MSQENQEDNSDFWMRHMRSGQFEKAWEHSDAVLKSRAGQPCWHWPRHFQYIWDGTPLHDKRVLVRCYHGLGDTIQFIRYIPLVKAIASEVIVWAQKELLPLLESMPEIDQLLPLHDGTPEAEYDVDVELMELPHIFRTTLETIPNRVPYLHAEPMPLEHKQKLAVGLVWQAGDWDERRSFPFSLYAPLTELDGVDFYLLQFKAASNGWKEEFGIYPGDLSVYDTARLIQSLDLVITVDSMPAHLAGALGKPVWNLLQKEADWRWMENREDSPWYPTMRLFRQEQAGDWPSVIQRVKVELEKVVIEAEASEIKRQFLF